MTNNIKMPNLPEPHTRATYATSKNTPSVKAGYEQGGYEKTPPLFDEHQMEAYAREAVRLNADPVPDGYALIGIDALRAWGVYEQVNEMCAYPVPTHEPSAQQPLTDEQAASLAKQLGWDTMPERFPLIVRAVEQSHGIGVKND